jgi:hypothetical protein
MSYIPKPSDKVKIVALHESDAYSKNPSNYIGLVVTIDENCSIIESHEGYFTFYSHHCDGSGYCFYAAKVEPVSK